MTILEHPNDVMVVLFFNFIATTGLIMKWIVFLLPHVGRMPRTKRYWLLLSPNAHGRLRPFV
jgi:hypothetical protein